MAVSSGRRLSKTIRTRSPSFAWIVGPGAVPLKPQRSNTRPGITSCFTGSAVRWNTFTPPSIVNGRSGMSGVSTRAGLASATLAAIAPLPSKPKRKKKFRRLPPIYTSPFLNYVERRGSGGDQILRTAMEGEIGTGGEGFARTANKQPMKTGRTIAGGWLTGATIRLDETGVASTRWSNAKCANGQVEFALDCGFS